MTTTLSDVEVILDILKPALPTNLGTLAIFVPGKENGIERYVTIEDATDALKGNDKALQAAQGYFDQDEHNDTLVVITYADLGTALADYASEGWEFATICAPDEAATQPSQPTQTTTPTNTGTGTGSSAGTASSSASSSGSSSGSGTDSGSGDKGSSSGSTTTPPATTGGGKSEQDDVLLLSNFIEGQETGFAVVGVPATADTVTSSQDTQTKYAQNTRTIFFASGADDKEASYGVGALIGALGNQVVGSITWKSKTLKNVKPVDLTAAQVLHLHQYGIFTYVTKAGIDQTSEGFTIGGEFIDALHGDDWVKTEMESQLQHLLSTSKKVSYDTKGIAQVGAVATAVLLDATNNGIVLIDDKTGQGTYTVSTVSRADTPAADIAKRHYGGLSFTYTRSGAIHSITVHGTVQM